MVPEKPESATLPQRKHPHNFKRRAAKGALVVGAFGVIGLGAFYAANWQSLQHLPQLAHSASVHQRVKWTHLNQVSPWFPKALIATEDRSFYTNWGISFQGIARAAWVDLQTGQFTQGGSTITQELIRDLVLTPAKTIPRKVSGILLSLMTTVLYSKQQILTMFINEVYLGDNAYGVGQAAESYFGISAQHLNLPESALLAGLPQLPSAYDPLVHYKLAKMRQLQFLNGMVQDRMITRQQAMRAYRAPLPLK